jgi:hypothetical protein
MFQIKFIDFIVYTIIIIFVTLYVYNKYSDKLYSCPVCPPNRSKIIKVPIYINSIKEDEKEEKCKEKRHLKFPKLKPMGSIGGRTSSQSSSLNPVHFESNYSDYDDFFD